jgi:hypothetical protein
VINTLSQAAAIAGTLGYPSKMPGTAYGIPASACKVGSKLVTVPGSTCFSCYAMKGNYITGSVKKSHAVRLAGIAHPQWVDAIVYLLRRAHGLDGGRVSSDVSDAGWHRWHDSGDLQSVTHLASICQVAEHTPELRHWLPTREAGMLAAFKAAGGTLPENLTIRVSATMVDGSATVRHAQTSTVHHAAAAPAGHVCPAPTTGNACGTCRACWSRDVGNVSYHKH